MKKTIIAATIISAIIVLGCALTAQAEVSTPNFFKLISNKIVPIKDTWKIGAQELCIGNDCRTVWPTSGSGTSTWTTSTDNVNWEANWLTKTTDSLAEGVSRLYFTLARARQSITESIPGIDYSSSTGNFSLTTGYTIPLTASTSDWTSAYNIVNTSSTYWNQAYGWGNHATAGYLTSESDPIWNLQKTAYLTTTTAASTYYPLSNPNGYISSFTESDPIWTAASSSYLTKNQASSTYQPIGSYLTVESDPIWNSQKLSYLTTTTAATTYYPLTNPSGFISSYNESDPIWSSASTSLTVANFLSPNISQWTNDAGYITSTSITETDPIWSAEKDGYITTSTAAAVLSNYLTIVDASSTYQPIGAYLTVESDPIWNAASSSYAKLTDLNGYLPVLTWNNSEASKITVASTTNWTTAYNWGNHATAGYLLSSTASSTYLPITTWTGSEASKITSASTTNWTTAYLWGNHASAGYLTAETDPIWSAASSSYLTTTTAASTYYPLTNPNSYISVESDPVWNAASTSLTVANFSSPNVSQWTNDAGYLTAAAGEPLWNAASTTVPYLGQNNVFTGENSYSATTTMSKLSISGSGIALESGIQFTDSVYASDGTGIITFIPATLAQTVVGIDSNVMVFGTLDESTSTIINLGNFANVGKEGGSVNFTEIENPTNPGEYYPIITGQSSLGASGLLLADAISIYDTDENGAAISFNDADGGVSYLAWTPPTGGTDIYGTLTYLGMFNLQGGSKIGKSQTSTVTGFYDSLRITGKIIGSQRVGDKVGIQFSQNAVGGLLGTGVLTGNISTVFTNNAASTYAADMVFYTQNFNSSSTPLEVMRLTSDGRVGINTSTPAYSLTVAGDAYITATTTVAGPFNVKGGISGNGKYDTSCALDPGVSGCECDDGDVMVGINADLTIKCRDLTY